MNTTRAVARIEITADVRYLPALVEFSRNFFKAGAAESCDDRTIYALQLIVSEACTNVMRHAYADGRHGPLFLELSVEAGTATIVVRDHGRPFDPADAPQPDLDNPKGHGLGLFIIRESVDEVAYSRRDDLNVLTLVKRFPSPD